MRQSANMLMRCSIVNNANIKHTTDHEYKSIILPERLTA